MYSCHQICTIGPKTNSVEAINKLRDSGLNVVRMYGSPNLPSPEIAAETDNDISGTSPTYATMTLVHEMTDHPPANTGLQGEYAYHQSVIDNARAAEKAKPGRQIAIALDTKGPVCDPLLPGEKRIKKTESVTNRKSGLETPQEMPTSPSLLAPR